MMSRLRTPGKSAALPSPAPATSPAPGSSPAVIRRLLTSAAVVLAVVLLFLAYLQVSRTYAENSDESNDLLMAWDMLHGNVLLHGWYLSDVSFYTTELPQYAMLEHFLGLHADTAHVAAAMTYTLVVVLAVLLARGTVSGRDAWPRMLLTAGIMFAPQLGVGVFILLLSLGHIGTAVPLMLTWLVLDRFDGAEGTKRRWAPVIAGLLLTWALIADPLVLVVGVVPLVAVCAVRAIRGGPRWYEVSLAVAAILAEGLASLVNWLLRASGGFILHPVGYSLASPRSWPKHAYVTAEGLLALFGAKPQGSAIELAFALVHLAGVVLVVWAIVAGGAALRQLARPDQPDPAGRDSHQRGGVRAEHAGRRDRPERQGVRRRAAVRSRAGGPDAGGRPAGPRARSRRLARVAEMAGLGRGRRLCGQPRVRRGSAVGPRGQRPAGGVPGRAPPDQRHRRVLGVERGHRGQRRRRHDPGRADRNAAARPVGGQGFLV